MSKSKTIPDLRADHQEFTLEHCSVLLERMIKMIELAYGDEVGADLIKHIDVRWMRDDLIDLIPVSRLSELFSNPFGQPFLVGLYFGHFILKVTEADEGDE
jgi:hypothetical protein